jgi:sec-independent protein translocase protein TatA
VFLGEIFGPDLLIVVIVVAVLVFGGSAIPKLAKNLGSAKSEFEKGLKEAKSTDATRRQAGDADRDQGPRHRQVVLRPRRTPRSPRHGFADTSCAPGESFL